MNREFLEQLGLEKEQIDNIMKEHGKSINSYKEDAAQVKVLEGQVEQLQQQIGDRDEQLNELKKIDAEGLQAKIDELQQANEATKSDYEQKLQQQAFDHALDRAITGANPTTDNTAKAIKALLDTESIKLDGDKLLGFDDQIKALQESDAHLFKSDSDDGNKAGFKVGGDGKGNATPQTDVQQWQAAFSDGQQNNQ